MMNLDLIVEDLIRNNLMWETEYCFPVTLVDDKKSNAFTTAAKIEFLPFKENGRGIKIYDKRIGLDYQVMFPPKQILFNKRNLNESEHVIRQLLLHELNHWYTYEIDTPLVQGHGKEFKRNGRQNGLEDKFNRAVIKWDDNQTKYYYARCVKCNEISFISELKKDVLWYCKCMNTSCCGCDMKYAGVTLYTEKE